jgi:hypothetical protein
MKGQFKKFMMEKVMSDVPLNGGEKSWLLDEELCNKNLIEKKVPGELIYDLQQCFLQLIAKL